MIIHGIQQLREFGEKHSDAKSDLASWETDVEQTQVIWTKPLDVRARYPKVRLIGKQAIFKICGNKYRLWVQIAYGTGIILIKNFGTHNEYDKWKII